MFEGASVRKGLLAGRPRAEMHPTKRAILDASIELFGKHGYADTGVQAIVDHTGTTKGAFYHHFSGKEDLLKVIHDDFIDYYSELLACIEATTTSPREIFAKYYEEFFLTLDEFRLQMTIFYQGRHYLSGDGFADVRRKRDALEHKLISVIERGIAEGEFRPLASAKIMLYGMVGLSVHIATWYRPEDGSAEAIGQMVTQVVLNGLNAPDRASGP